MKFKRKTELPDDVVYRICTLVELGYTYKQVCNMLDLEGRKYELIISDIVTGKQYKHISKYFDLPERHAVRFSKKEIRKICELISKGYSVRDIYHEAAYENHSYSSTRLTVIMIFKRQWYKYYSQYFEFPETLVTKGFVKLKRSEVFNK